MKPDESDASGLFSQQVVQYSIPHYQRPQSWKPDQHWEPLWADIEAKANDWLAGIQPKQHYLGAIVMAKRPRFGVRGMDRCLVIDGQQRLSTLQYLLKALFFVCKENEYADGTTSIHRELFNENENMMDVPDVQRFKLWPTFRDREAHKSVMLCTSIEEVRAAFPQRFTQGGLLYQRNDHPRPLHATWFFYLKVKNWLADLPGEQSAVDALELLRQAVTRSLQLVVLWLEPQDDPQVIFECLNGRGEPLRPTDLIKNYVFMSAEAPGPGQIPIEVSEDSPLFKKWSTFDSDPWLAPQTRGRLTKPKLEWLVYYSLQAETGDDIDSSQTYHAYQRWAGGASNRVTADQQVDTLLSHAASLTAFVECDPSVPIGRFGNIAKAVDVTIISPLALAVAKNCGAPEQELIFKALASYLVRREACGLTKKSYNQIFFSLLRQLRTSQFSASALIEALSEPTADTSVWPSDERFAAALMTRSLYRPIGLIRLLLTEAANRLAEYRSGAEVTWSPDWTNLHIEHLLPDSWYEYWPLPNGQKVTEQQADRLQLVASESDRPLADLIIRRQRLKNTIGNLTILNGPLNVQFQNYPWETKKQGIREATQLRMNFDLVALDSWDEDSIESRSRMLISLLSAAWPGPSALR